MLVAKGDNKQDGPDETAKTEGVIYRSRCGTIKIPPCSKNMI
jgi:hypothetical protein